MPNAQNKSTSNNDDKPNGGKSGANKKNQDKSSSRGSQSDNRGSGSGGKGCLPGRTEAATCVRGRARRGVPSFLSAVATSWCL